MAARAFFAATDDAEASDVKAAYVARLVASGAWELVARTERVPYLPHNQEFGRDTEIVISTWRKL